MIPYVFSNTMRTSPIQVPLSNRSLRQGPRVLRVVQVLRRVANMEAILLRRLHSVLQQLCQILLPELCHASSSMAARFFTPRDKHVTGMLDALDLTLQDSQLGRIPFVVC